MHPRSLRPAAALAAAFLLALGLSAAPARAASTVELTYDLADTSLNALWTFGNVIQYSNDRPQNGTLSGSMQIRYTSDSSSNMPIRTGPVSLLSFYLHVQDNVPYRSVTLKAAGNSPTLVTQTGSLTGTFNWRLTAPATGSITSGGALVGVSGNLLLTGYANCLQTNTACQNRFGLPTFTVPLSYSKSGAFSLAGNPSATRDTLTGSGPIAVGFNAIAFGYGFFLKTFRNSDVYGNAIVGREIIREADGHETRVIPEPGTLLLLGSGAAGLGLLGHSRRRRPGRV